jgi:hypothetical protein
MKIELLILIVTGFFIINVYHDGKYLKMIKSWKKYYQMAFYGFLGLSLYLFVKKYPEHSRGLFTHANSFIKYMPIDKESGDFLTPLFKASAMSDYGQNMEDTPQYRRMMGSGSSSMPNLNTGSRSNTTKRCVSETKKKFVAANQNWQCAHCSIKLPAWFEVDHKIRLDRGGDNHISNLEALCRNCHGKKTAMESML